MKETLYLAFALMLLAVILIGSYFYFFPYCDGNSGAVCGADGSTYEHACAARDAGVNVAYNGECNVACSDSDFGKDALVKGTLTTSSGQLSDSCSGTDSVIEFYCTGSSATSEVIPCPSGYGCSGGQCIQNAQVSCSDSDNGLSYYTSGTVTVGSSPYSDSCDGANLIEYHCVNGNVANSSYSCPSGYSCSGGRCTDRTCTDNEASQSMYSSGTTTVTTSSGSNSYTDSCSDASTVREYSCDDNNLKTEYLTCSAGYTCADGVCYSSTGCYDTDGEGTAARYSRGTVYYNYESYVDYCSSDSLVVEYACSGSLVSHSTMSCSSGYECRSGRCVSINECDDSDGGMDYYEQGTAEYGTDDMEDYCVDENTVREYYCAADDDIDSTTFDCPAGYECSGGECVDEDAPHGAVTCSDSDGGQNDYTHVGTASLSDGSESETDDCGAWDILTEYYCDGNEIASVDHGCAADGMECVVNRCIAVDSDVCSDSDDGEDPDEYGEVMHGGESYPDECFSDDAVLEWYCPTPDSHDFGIMGCDPDEECVGGECVVADEVTCSETDDGDDVYHYGVATLSTGAHGEDFCSDATNVIEYWCGDDGSINHMEYGCWFDDLVCIDGECVVDPDFDGDGVLLCEDSDGGKVTDVLGTVIYGGDDFGTDECTDATHIREYYCDIALDVEATSHVYSCGVGNACFEGECVGACSDPDGDDQDVFGRVSFMDGVHSDSCSGDNVLEWFCADPATPDSHVLVCDAGSSCDGGECVLDPFCNDPDVGANAIYIGSITRTADLSGTDICVGESVREYACLGEGIVSSVISCGANFICGDDGGPDACLPRCTETDDGVQFGDTFYPDECSGASVAHQVCLSDYKRSSELLLCLPGWTCVAGSCARLLPP
ncbi:MAG: hypothetical protein ABIJ10_01430 [Candidatus Micrarchaeota archaeon]|nr:hypothetical protein [Candidatus Micrarchaeota archaeon]MBU1887193.1 hypothetical protein [Candidatus Micrarchaeota archaeon]